MEKIVVRPGAHVEPNTVILELSSPDLEQAALDAESQAKAGTAELTTLRATLQRELLNQESTTAQVHSEYQQAKNSPAAASPKSCGRNRASASGCVPGRTAMIVTS